MTDQDPAPESAAVRLALRIRQARQEAGLSQSELGYRIGYTRNYVSMAERVGGNLPARSIVDALEHGLDTGGALRKLWAEAEEERLARRRGAEQANSTRTREDIVRASMPMLRTALAACDTPDDGPVQPLHVLRSAVKRVTELRVQARYTQLVNDLPNLFYDLGRAKQQAMTSSAQREATRMLVLAYRAADGLAFKYGYEDLSARIIESMRFAAAQVADPLLSASVAYVRTETFFFANDLSTAQRALVQAIDAMPSAGKAAVDGSAAVGALQMRAAVVAARAGQVDEAADHLAEARHAAEFVPEGVYLGTAFGPASVRIHEVAVAQELGDSVTAVQRGSGWHPPRELPAERRSHFYIDLAPAQLNIGHYNGCFASLRNARLIAPQHTREHPRVRGTLKSLLRARRTVNEELRTFATWAGVR